MSTVDIDKELREWLADFATGMQGDSYYIIAPDDIYDDDIKELKATLKAEILAKMPKQMPEAGNYGDATYGDGHNDCLTEITKIVNEL